MNKEEIKLLQERTYAISNSLLPLNAFFNDIRDNDNPRFRKDLAYQDLKLIVDEFYRLREETKIPTIEDIKIEWKKLGYDMVFRNNGDLIDLENLDEMSIKMTIIKIATKRKIYIKVDNVYFDKSIPITYNEHQLLTKTFAALGWLDE